VPRASGGRETKTNALYRATLRALLGLRAGGGAQRRGQPACREGGGPEGQLFGPCPARALALAPLKKGR